MHSHNRLDENDDDRHSSSLTESVMVLVVFATSSVIVRKLQVRYMHEECIMSQRPACEVTVNQVRISRLLDRVLGWEHSGLESPLTNRGRPAVH
jgi:hypothetical protein